MKAYPGEILAGRAFNVISVSGTGQLVASDAIPTALAAGKPAQLAVRTQLDEVDSHPLPGGAQGQAAVYTGDVQIAGIPVMFLIRANSWMNYLF